MGPIVTAVAAIGAVILGWITIEIACKPCLEKGREAIDRSLNPNFDPDASLVAPLRPPPSSSSSSEPLLDPSAAAAAASAKGF